MKYRMTLNNEKGVSLVLLALAFTVILGFSALAVDVAHLYHVKNQLQVAADAAALAGVGELFDPATGAVNAQRAKDAAQKIAAMNTADVAYKAGISPADPGYPMPVMLNTNLDVEVGNWDISKTPSFTPDGTPYNAVLVYAKRAGAANQPPAQNWFAKIFALLGDGFDVTNMQATALAAKPPLPIVSIAVNEYWGATGPNSLQPYTAANQAYPNSFVRQYNVTVTGVPDTSAANASGVFRNTFAILGAASNSNMGSSDSNSYVNMEWRSNYYSGIDPTTGEPSFFQTVAASTNNPDCSSQCNTIVTPGTPPSSVSPGKGDAATSLSYLVQGLPTTMLPPTAVYEFRRQNLTDYPELDPTKALYSSKNDPSNCPYGTALYFSTSGNEPLNRSVGGKTVDEWFKKGDRFIAMVYDGTHNNPSDGKLITIVGYVPIEVDGYDSGGGSAPDFRSYVEDPTYAYNQGRLSNTNGNSMYGHALSNIIQPSLAAPNGGCDVMADLKNAQMQYSYIQLVGTYANGGIRYGTNDDNE